MTDRVFWGAWWVSVVCLTSACQPKPSSVVTAQERFEVRVWTLSLTGQSFARACAQTHPGIFLTTVAARNGPALLKSLEEGNADVGFVTASLLYEGDEEEEFSERFKKISGLAVVQPQVEHVLVRHDSAISSLKDLAGREVAIGRPGTRNAITAPKLLAWAELSRPARLIHADFETAISKLFDATVDAVLIPAPVPSPVVANAIAGGARLVDIRAPLADNLRRHVRFMHPYTIPPDTYPGQKDRAVTLGMDTMFLARRDLPDSIAQAVVAEFFDCLPRLAAIDASFHMVDTSRASATPLPLHPGAALYYRQRELAP